MSEVISEVIKKSFVYRELRLASLEYIDNIRRGDVRTLANTAFYSVEALSLFALGHSSATFYIPTILTAVGTFGITATSHLVINRLLPPTQSSVFKAGNDQAIDAPFTVVDHNRKS